MKFILSALLLTILSCPAYSKISSGKEGGGGGGISRSGVYMTFGTAGFFVDPASLDEIPGLPLVEESLRDVLGPGAQLNGYLELLFPGGARQYFDIQSMDPEMYRNLQQELGKASGQPPDSIVVYAFTDKKNRVTYLLPEFYKLNPVEQAAIIFHEFYWLADPNASYETVIATEVAFQRYIEKKQAGKYDSDFGRKILNLLGPENYQISLNLDLENDLTNNSLNSLKFQPDSTVLKISALVALEDVVSCTTNKPDWILGNTEYTVTIKGPNERVLLYQLSKKNPGSFFLKNISNYLAANREGLFGELQIVFTGNGGPTPVTDACRNFILSENYRWKSSRVEAAGTIGSTSTPVHFVRIRILK